MPPAERGHNGEVSPGRQVEAGLLERGLLERGLLEAIRRASGNGGARWATAPKRIKGGYFDRKRIAWFSRLAALRILTSVGDWRSGRDLGRPADHPSYLLAARLEGHAP